MPQTLIQCNTCGARLEADLNEAELRTLQAERFITRYCRRCAGNTRWVSRTAAAARLERDAPIEGFRAAVTAPTGPKRVLVIDDDPDILSVLGKILKSLGLELDVASSGREAIAKLARENYDLILSDIRMPDLDGQQLFEFLAQSMAEYKERVIFLTGDTGNPATMDFLHKSNCPYLTKPVEIPVLLSLLHHFFSRE